MTDLFAVDRALAVPHREDDQPCACDECMAYGAEDNGADWYRIPPANRIVMRVLDGGDDRFAPLVTAFRDHEAALAVTPDLRSAVEADPWSLKEGSLRERLEWARAQHQVWAEACDHVRPSDGRPAQRSTYAEEAAWHFACARWYEQMVRDLDAAALASVTIAPDLAQRIHENVMRTLDHWDLPAGQEVADDLAAAIEEAI